MDDRNGSNWFMFLAIGSRKPIMHKLASFNSLIVLEPENKHGANIAIKFKCVQREVNNFSGYIQKNKNKIKKCIINASKAGS